MGAMKGIVMDGFFAQVYGLVARIPRGRVASYGQLALMLGRPNGARAVGWAMRTCPDNLPWQRVVRADGSIAAGGWAELRRARLMDEGVVFTEDGRVDMALCQWDGREAEGSGLI
jgi:methylated-DNA-protein-cysteine methyltransferase-like protein